MLKVKLLDIGPPKAVLRLALQPPDSDDIERTVLLLKQVRKTGTSFAYSSKTSLRNSKYFNLKREGGFRELLCYT